MAKNCENGQAPRRRWLLAMLAGVLAAGMFAGCSQTPAVTQPQPADPLHGVLTPPGMPQPASTPKPAVGWNQPPAQQFGTADNSSTNNATLAGMTWQSPTQLAKPLAIDDNKSPPQGTLTTGSKSQPPPTPAPAPGYVPPNANPKVELVPDIKPINPNPPTSAVQPVPTSGQAPVQPVSATSTPSAPLGPDALKKQLQDRGVINQKEDKVPGGVLLTCYVAQPGGGFRVLSTDPDHPAADYNSAAQAILQQLDNAKQ